MRAIGSKARDWALLGAAMVCLLFGTAQAGEPLEGATVEQIIGILHDKGLIDEEQQERLLIKNAAEQQKEAKTASVAAGLLDGWDLYGDFRLRHEFFDYQTDSLGNRRDNRYRLRYRLRMGFEKTLTDTLTFGMRVVTGGSPDSSENRSSNQTMGAQEDFDNDSLWIDRAYVKWQLPQLGELRSTLVGGKIANPFVWKYGKDLVVWDHDVQPEGGALRLQYPIDERTELFSNVGYFVVDERSSANDPKLWAGQLGATTEAGGFDLGMRGSFYGWRTLDDDFVDRAIGLGNMPNGYDRGQAHIGELSAFAGTDLSEDWPLLFIGTFAQNFSAEDDPCAAFDTAGGTTPDTVICAGGVVPAGAAQVGLASSRDDDQAWGLALELGSSKRIVKLGFGYYHIEANSVVSLVADSDLFDGFTNRRGWVAYGARRLGSATEVKFALYNGDYIENDDAYVFSRAFSDRLRLQTDLVWKF